MISFCTCIKNRSDNLKRLIASMAAMQATVPFELVVVDFKSDDVTWSDVKAPFDLHVVQCSGKFFNRSQGLNTAAAKAKYQLLFFIDVDMLVPRDMLSQLQSHVSPGKCWFPICYSLHKDKPAVIRDSSRHSSRSNGWWRTEGAGMLGIMQQDLLKIGRWNEQIGQTYGKEDNEICRRAGEQLQRQRTRCIGLFHVWHPTGKDYRERYHKRKSGMVIAPKVHRRRR